MAGVPHRLPFPPSVVPMTSLPDRTRPRLTQPVRRASGSALRLAGAAVWRALHPTLRERFLEAPRPAPLPRLHVESCDGWSVPLFRVPTVPGASAEPVLLLHTAACAAEALRYGRRSLAGALAEAGFAVFLAAQRGDREAVGPQGAAPRLRDVVGEDLPAMLAAIRAHSGAAQVHVVGFGLGGLLAMDLGSRCPDEVASVTALAPPLRWPAWRSEARRLHLAARLAPPSWALPLRTMGRMGAPLVGTVGTVEGARLRGALAYASEDLPAGMLAELARWFAVGRVELVPGQELEAACRAARAPLHVVRGREDAVCAEASLSAAREGWGGAVHLTEVDGYGHVDLVLGAQAAEDVFAPCLAWLEPLRHACWGAVEDVA